MPRRRELTSTNAFGRHTLRAGQSDAHSLAGMCLRTGLNEGLARTYRWFLEQTKS